jgi:hypothetical protein
MKRFFLVTALAVLTAATPFVLFNNTGDAPSASALSAQATAFLQSLDADQRQQASFDFGNKERSNWQFVPNIYPGITLSKLSLRQRRAVHRLMLTTLSAAGYHKVTTIMQLEDVLRRVAESKGQKAPHRDPGRYALAFFGQPSDTKPWGIRLQGHHLSLNVSVIGGKIVASTPAFLGSNPAEIRHGHHAGLRALPAEEDIAFSLLDSLSAEQKKVAILSAKAPRDVLHGPGTKSDVLGKRRGLTARAMTVAQRAICRDLIDTYLNNAAPKIAAHQRSKMATGSIPDIHFAWMGSQQRGKGHYYRLHGPNFAIEYDNTQNAANHVHTVFHDLTNDFAQEDLLQRHYREQHQQKKR